MEVRCIHFGHPIKKNNFVWGSPWRAAMTRVGAPWEAPWGARRKGRGGGRRMREGAWLRVQLERHGEGLLGAAGCSWLFSVSCTLYVRSWTWGRREGGKREEKEKEGIEKRKKRKKYGKFFKLENLRGEK
jgi:hypothetical protein